MKGLKNYMLMSDSPSDLSVAYLLERAKNLSPNKPAITFEDVTYTWQQVYDRVVSLSCYLKDRGVSPKDRVVFIGENSNKYIELMFACSFINAIIVPVNFRLAEREIKDIIQDCDPALVLYDIADGCYESVSDIPEFHPGINEDIYGIIYTGGTTGTPKGAVITHKAMYIASMAFNLTFNLNGDETSLISLPLFHIASHNRFFASTLLQSHSVIMRKFETEKFLQNIEKHKVNVFIVVPTMSQMLLDYKEFLNYDTSSVKIYQSGGAPPTEEQLEKLRKFFPNAKVLNNVGITECGGTVLLDGKPVTGIQVKIEEGELLVRSPYMMREYWQKPEETSKVIKNSWYHTGDAVRKEGDRYILCGRVKDMFISGGENVYPLEIERVLMSHPSVKQAAVVGIPDKRWGEVGCAFIVGKNADYVNYCRKYLGDFKVPKQYRYVDELPLTSVGKVDKQALKLL